MGSVSGRLATRAVAFLAVLAALAALAVAGCAHLPAPHWPWRHGPQAQPPAVHELDIGGAAADTFPQSWKRNTLLIDLSAASGSGSITLKPIAGSAWPVRRAFRVRPGAFAQLEVRAAQRLTLPVAPAAGAPLDLELPPGVYTPATPQLSVSWGTAAVPAQ
ncbi:MAG: hypothetical protein JO361_06080 [Gammaproteobacteria bacterium]|nr:hypothetical protein [Gammaproteobacteria bacterium]